MKQQTLAVAADQEAGFERYRRPTKRDVFLATMEEIVPWRELCAVIEPHYPKAGNGRPPIGLERMLRMYFVQHWFNLADDACEEALLDSTALRRFVGIDLGRERVPDGTTLLKFRRLLERHKLGEQLFAAVGQVLQARGLKVGTGTIVDATIIGAPSSTKNADKARDPEMHQTRKGQQWFFGMKLHIGVDSRTGLAHRAVVTAANVHDKHPLPQLAARQGAACLRRQRLRQPEGADPGQSAAGQGLHQPARAQGLGNRRGPALEEPEQVQGTCPRGTCLRRGQEAVGLYQGALSRAGQERHALVRRAGAGQHLLGSGTPGMSAPEMRAMRGCKAAMAVIGREFASKSRV